MDPIRIHVWYVYIYMLTFAINIPPINVSISYIPAPWILIMGYDPTVKITEAVVADIRGPDPDLVLSLSALHTKPR